MPEPRPDPNDWTVRRWAASNLAARLLAGPWTRDAIDAAIGALRISATRRTRVALGEQVYALAENTYPPAPRRLTAFLLGSSFFRPPRERIVPAVLDPPVFAPLPPFAGLAIPALATPADLAAWLDVPPPQLEWLADERRSHGREAHAGLRHYRYALLPRRDGTPRLLEAPKQRMKAIQRRILHEILSAVPVHARAHGFVAGRSCLSGALVHASEAVVATFDLTRFFPSIGLGRVHGIFRSLGYPWAVARLLAGLCTTVTPEAVLRRLPEKDRVLHGVPHLPQGAPTSPVLANLLAWRLDMRLDGLARHAGGQYTRYADDLAFSGDERFAAGLGRLRTAVGTIVAEEGFALNDAKTRIMPRSDRQRVTGVVVNAHCNVGRAEFDALKAVLHNCARFGPDGQNRTGTPDFRRHLDGRVAWVEQVNPARGSKLRRHFETIDWADPRNESKIA